MPKHDVITAKLTCHIPVDLADPDSVRVAAERTKALLKAAKGFGQASMPKPCFGRVPAPEPEPADDGLDIPDNLRRTAQTEAAE
jgi:hypothetical protein